MKDIEVLIGDVPTTSNSFGGLSKKMINAPFLYVTLSEQSKMFPHSAPFNPAGVTNY